MSTADVAPLALVYVRVSTAEQVESGASLDAQAATLAAEAARRGYRVEVLREEGRSAKNLTGRPMLLDALDRLRRGDAAALVAQRLDRVSRSVADFAGLLDRSAREGWALVVTEADVDTSTPSGRFLLNVLASAAQFERDLIGARTRDALAQRRAEGIRLGRPSALPSAVLERIAAEHTDGRSLRTIAQGLTADGVLTATGRPVWHASTVRQALATVALDAEAATVGARLASRDAQQGSDNSFA